jgi:hypothetical protein
MADKENRNVMFIMSTSLFSIFGKVSLVFFITTLTGKLPKEKLMFIRNDKKYRGVTFRKCYNYVRKGKTSDIMAITSAGGGGGWGGDLGADGRPHRSAAERRPVQRTSRGDDVTFCVVSPSL